MSSARILLTLAALVAAVPVIPVAMLSACEPSVRMRVAGATVRPTKPPPSAVEA